MKIGRVLSRAGRDPFDGIAFTLYTPEIPAADGGEGERLAPVEIPEGWSPIAAETLSLQCLCPVPVPAALRRIREKGVPEFLWRSEPDPEALALLPEDRRLRSECSARDVILRMAGSWSRRGWTRGCFASEKDARAYHDEICRMLVRQMAAPGAQVWRHAGLDWAYGLALDAGAETPAPEALCDISDPGVADFAFRRFDAEQRAAALALGSAALRRHLAPVFDAVRLTAAGPAGRQQDPLLDSALGAARTAGVPEAVLRLAVDLARHGQDESVFALLDPDWDGAACREAAAQQPGLVRLDGGFLARVAAAPQGADAALWQRIGLAAWASGDPGAAFADTAAAWDGPAAAGAPRAVLNLAAFLDAGAFDSEAFAHAVRLWVLTLEIALPAPGEPGTAAVRPLELGHANLAGLLLALGIAYDSAAGRSLCAALTALMGGVAAATSADLAALLGPFPDHAQHAESLLRLIGNHRHAAHGNLTGFAGLPVPPRALARESCPEPVLADLARAAWDEALAGARRHGMRHARLTGIFAAPDAARLMDCRADGIDPGTALLLQMPLPDGGFRILPDPGLASALAALGYDGPASERILAHVLGHGSLAEAPFVNHAALIGQGFGRAEIGRIEAALEGAVDIRHLFSQWVLGRRFCRDVLGIPADLLASPGFDMLRHLGFGPEEIAAAALHALGARALEGAPDLAPEHLAVFDCPATQGGGSRVLRPLAVMDMAAAAQSFVSGEVRPLLRLQEGASPADLLAVWETAYGLGLKSCRVQRDGAGLARPQPLADPPPAEEAAQGPKASVQSGAPALPLASAPGAGPLHVAATRQRGLAEPLPGRRRGFVHELELQGRPARLQTGEYADGRPGEIRFDMPQESPELRALLRALSASVSLGLQHGVPLADLLRAIDPQTGAQGQGPGLLDGLLAELAQCYPAGPAEAPLPAGSAPSDAAEPALRRS